MDLSLFEAPYPYFEHLRSKGPAVYLPQHNVFAATSFDEALAVSLDNENLFAVNRDPEKFASPTNFQLDRPKARDHFAFGRGSHACHGAALARTETRISLERILEPLENISLDADFHGPENDRRFKYLPTYVFRALQDLHLTSTRDPDARNCR